jgi:hypothetical protein
MIEDCLGFMLRPSFINMQIADQRKNYDILSFCYDILTIPVLRVLV